MLNTFTVLDNAVDDGTPVTIKLTMHLDGSISISGGGQAQGQADLGIVAGSTVQKPGSGEFYQPELLSFTANWNVVTVGGYGTYSQIGWQADEISGYDQNNYGFNGAGAYYYFCQAGDPHCYYSETYNGLDPLNNFLPVYVPLDIPLVLTFTVNVGQTYTLFENLYNFSDFESGAIGSTDLDFSHNFAGTVTSDDPNVVLDWGVPLNAFLYGNFTGNGLWQWNGTTWSQVNTVSPANMVASDSMLYGDFGAGGLWQWDGTTWSQVNAVAPTSMVGGL
jgi:hypothetical protein